MCIGAERLHRHRQPAMTRPLPIDCRYETKKTALKVARAKRAEGKTVKVFHHAGVYTQPGRGLASYSYYTVEEAA
jgi:hypothetical protein